jgi:hypothetical protein
MKIFMAQSTSATQVDGNDSVDGSSWLSGVSYGSHTLYVALLDQADSNNVLDTDHHTFTYQSGSGGTQSGTSGTQSPDSVYIAYPNVGTLYSSDGNGMQVNWNYQSQSNDMQSLSWAYKLDEDFYGTVNKCHASGRKRQCGRIELVKWSKLRKSHLVCCVARPGGFQQCIGYRSAIHLLTRVEVEARKVERVVRRVRILCTLLTRM